MKLVLAVIADDDTVALMDALIEAGFGATKLASTGGFLLRGNTTLLIGVNDAQVEQVMDIIRRVCRRRKKMVPQAVAEVPTTVNMPIEVDAGGSVVFVLEVSQCQRI